VVAPVPEAEAPRQLRTGDAWLRPLRYATQFGFVHPRPIPGRELRLSGRPGDHSHLGRYGSRQERIGRGSCLRWSTFP